MKRPSLSRTSKASSVCKSTKITRLSLNVTRVDSASRIRSACQIATDYSKIARHSSLNTERDKRPGQRLQINGLAKSTTRLVRAT